MTVAISRRDALLAALALPAAARAGAGAGEVGAIYRRSIAIDTLCIATGDLDERAAIAAGIGGVLLDLQGGYRTGAEVMAELHRWRARFAAPGSRVRFVRQAADFAEAKRHGQLAILPGSQDSAILGAPMFVNSDQNLDTLERFHAAGLRELQVTYSSNNGLGSGYADAGDGGLTRLGAAVVERMNALGMLIDISHSNERTGFETIARSTRPVAVTHAGCLSLHPDGRNKSDRLIRALADRGGYFGVYNMTLWMTAAPTSSVETIVDHIDHVVKVGGMDLAGFGGDHPIGGDRRSQAEQVRDMAPFAARNRGWPGGAALNGHVTASDMNGFDRLRRLAEALDRRHYRPGDIEKILGGNFVRVVAGAIG